MNSAAGKIGKALFVLGFVIVIILGAIIGVKKLMKIIPSYERVSIADVYEDRSGEDAFIVFEGEPMQLENNAKIMDGRIYLPISFVIEYMNSNFYWDQGEGTLTYTTRDDVIRMKTQDLTYFVNDEPLSLDIPIVQDEKGMAYVPFEILDKFCNHEVQYNEKNDFVIIDDLEREATVSLVVSKRAKLRVQMDHKSPFITTLEKGEVIKIYEAGGLWNKVRTQAGEIGYLHSKSLGERQIIEGKAKEVKEPEVIRRDFEGKINMVWHQVTNMTANNFVAGLLQNAKGLDVLSPTWFAISDNEGNVSSLADIAYVNFAHQRGYEVWALFSNSFNKEITHNVLSSTEKREKVIKQILAMASIYNLDGINIDFENVAAEDGIHYIQFIKELAPYLKKQELILSVDIYVPSAWTAHYNRPELGRVADYLIIMGYDEHWSGSLESGSVASIGFVTKGVLDTLKDVPKDKIILGVPFYTRLWEESAEGGEIPLSSKAYGMTRAMEILRENKATPVWDEEKAQYYAEYKVGDRLYRIWLEEERSLQEKLNLIESHDLAGAAGWKLGLEKAEIWDVLQDSLKK